MSFSLSRRRFLGRAGMTGCSLAASPLLTPVTFASAPWDTRLVVIILRGGMDGLDVVRPLGDPAFAALRPGLNTGTPALDLDGYFALHPGLAPLMPMWQAQELGFVHAVSTPYRDRRSHFDGQDILEAGTEGTASGARGGWLNRMLQQVPQARADTAFAIGNGDIRVLDGAAPVANWAPEANLRLSPQSMRLAELIMEDDAAMHAALAEAQVLAQETSGQAAGGAAPQPNCAIRGVTPESRGPGCCIFTGRLGHTPQTRSGPATQLAQSFGHVADAQERLGGRSMGQDGRGGDD